MDLPTLAEPEPLPRERRRLRRMPGLRHHGRARHARRPHLPDLQAHLPSMTQNLAEALHRVREHAATTARADLKRAEEWARIIRAAPHDDPRRWPSIRYAIRFFLIADGLRASPMERAAVHQAIGAPRVLTRFKAFLREPSNA